MPSNPKIIVVANGKGGVGKTTTSMALSGIFAEQYKLLAVDTDSQASFSWWSGRSSKELGFDVTQEIDPILLSHLREVKDYDLVVVDTPPALQSESLAAVISIADYLILPTPPAPMDLAALVETVKVAVLPTGVTLL
jgi:chromosome partitioning protein